MFSVLLVLLIIVSVFMIILILLQKSEGSGMSGSSAASMFGGALTGASAGNFLTKTTAWLAAIFFILCAALALVASRTGTESQQSKWQKEIMNMEVQQDIKNPVAPASDSKPAPVPKPAEPIKK